MQTLLDQALLELEVAAGNRGIGEIERAALRRATAFALADAAQSLRLMRPPVKAVPF